MLANASLTQVLVVLIVMMGGIVGYFVLPSKDLLTLGFVGALVPLLWALPNGARIAFYGGLIYTLLAVLKESSTQTSTSRPGLVAFGPLVMAAAGLVSAPFAVLPGQAVLNSTSIAAFGAIVVMSARMRPEVAVSAGFRALSLAVLGSLLVYVAGVGEAIEGGRVRGLLRTRMVWALLLHCG